MSRYWCFTYLLLCQLSLTLLEEEYGELYTASGSVARFCLYSFCLFSPTFGSSTVKMLLSYLEQSPRSRTIYTQLCFVFTTTHEMSQDRLIKVLEEGFRRVTTAFPWIAGQVIETKSDVYEPYRFRVEGFKDTVPLIIRDLTENEKVPSMKDMIDAYFPYSMLDEKLICSRSTLSEWVNEMDAFPVLCVQLSFVRGGVLLTVQACHSVLDIIGEAQMIRLLSKACRDEHFTETEVADGNMNRRDIVPLLQSHEIRDRHDAEVIENPPEVSQSSSQSVEELAWGYFSFSPRSLIELKQLAQSTLPSDSAFISTDDCISALIWQATANARLDRQSPSQTLTYVRQVDVRRHMGLPETYLGNMISQTNSEMTLDELARIDLGILAALLRRELDPDELKYQVRLQATEQAFNMKKATAKKDRANTVTMSSWSKVDLCDVDFNLGLGKPVAVRRPRFTSIEGVLYLLPKAANGEILAGLCLRYDDMHRLREDPNFLRHAQYIG